MRSIATGIPPGVTIDRSAATPLYRQLCDGYREAIAGRRLRGGQRLPSTRALAAELGISRIPILQAFEQLVAEGYFESRRGSGTFVASTLAADTPKGSGASGRASRPGPRVVARRPATLLRSAPEPWLGGFGAFRLSEPAVDHFPIPLWSRLIARHSRNTTRGAMTYGSPMGPLPLRQAVAAYLRTTRAVCCEADQIMW